MPGRGREAAVIIDLPHPLGHGIKLIRGRDALELVGRPAPHRLEIAVGNRQINARAAVGCRPEHQSLFAEADPPGVVARAAQEFELRAIRLEPVQSLTEPDRLAPHRSSKRRISDDAVDPVIQSISQVAGARVGIADSPPGEEHLLHVGPAVAVGVFEKERIGRLQDDHAAVEWQQAGGDIQSLGKDRELVGAAVGVGVFADRDPVAALAIPPLGIGIIRALGDPQPAAMVPVHAERLVDLGLGGKEPRLKALGHHQVPRSTLAGASGFCIFRIASPCVPHCRPGR